MILSSIKKNKKHPYFELSRSKSEINQSSKSLKNILFLLERGSNDCLRDIVFDSRKSSFNTIGFVSIQRLSS